MDVTLYLRVSTRNGRTMDNQRREAGGRRRATQLADRGEAYEDAGLIRNPLEPFRSIPSAHTASASAMERIIRKPY